LGVLHKYWLGGDTTTPRISSFSFSSPSYLGKASPKLSILCRVRSKNLTQITQSIDAVHTVHGSVRSVNVVVASSKFDENSEQSHTRVCQHVV